MADQFAKNGTEKENTRELKVPFKDLIMEYREEARKKATGRSKIESG